MKRIRTSALALTLAAPWCCGHDEPEPAPEPCSETSGAAATSEPDIEGPLTTTEITGNGPLTTG